MAMPNNQEERLNFLIQYLLDENKEYQDIKIPSAVLEKQCLLRSLMNVRPPKPIGEDFLQIQDAYLSKRLAMKGVTKLEDISPVKPGIFLWQGDITTLAVDAIVNAANSQMLGCYIPCHRCIDNAIHTYAGVQLRLECFEIMQRQGHEEETGQAIITKAYNLPCRYVLHTVGPIIYGTVTKADRELLASCYRSCLDLAAEYNLHSVAFCCISTGEFHFPNELAAQIAIKTVKEWQMHNNVKVDAVFNVFKDNDYAIYKSILQI